jgi:hypothetical protein
MPHEVFFLKKMFIFVKQTDFSNVPEEQSSAFSANMLMDSLNGWDVQRWERTKERTKQARRIISRYRSTHFFF